MNAPAVVNVNLPSLQMAEADLIKVLESSLYPGAKHESIKLVLGYCKAAGLDPLQKPVHIVPMDVKTDRKNADGKFIYEKRDVIMPGVGLYRIQAARTGEYAGMSEPEFGPEKTKPLGDKDSMTDFTFPEWCRVTVRRIVEGRPVEFTATEYWLENYATGGKWTTTPNSMWKKRPRGQIAKCTEAQALRKAFPELGTLPTAEEMEGKVIEHGEAQSALLPPAETKKPAENPGYTQGQFDINLPKWKALVDAGRSPEQIIAMVQSKYSLSEQQLKDITNLQPKKESSNEAA